MLSWAIQGDQQKTPSLKWSEDDEETSHEEGDHEETGQ